MVSTFELFEPSSSVLRGALNGESLPAGLDFSLVSSETDYHPLVSEVQIIGADAGSRRRDLRTLREKSLHAIGILYVDDALLFGRGLVANRRGLVVGGSLFAGPAQELTSPVFSAPLVQGDGVFHLTHSDVAVRHISGRVIMGICPGYRTFGHILVDLLPRILLAVDACEPDTPLVVPKELPAYVPGILEQLGISSVRLLPFDETREVISADQIVAATQVRRSSLWWPGAAALLRRLVSLARDQRAITPERIFIDRGPLKKQRRRLLDREIVERTIVSHGFTKVSPEKLPFFEQIALFAGASHVVGESGSGLHSSVFGPPNQRVGVIQSANLASFLQASLCSARGQSSKFLLGETLSFDRWCDYGDFVVGPDDLDFFLKEMVA